MLVKDYIQLFQRSILNFNGTVVNQKNFLSHTSDFHRFFHTLQECPDYSQYYIIKTGLKIRFNKILGSEEVY